MRLHRLLVPTYGVLDIRERISHIPPIQPNERLRAPDVFFLTGKRRQPPLQPDAFLLLLGETSSLIASAPPIVTTFVPHLVASSSGTLSGRVDPNGYSTFCTFEWVRTLAYEGVGGSG